MAYAVQARQPKRLRLRVRQVRDRLLAGLEAGGTKVLCALSDLRGRIVRDVRIATTTPDETFSEIAAFFRTLPDGSGIVGCGVASFGPLELDPASPRYGSVTDTPKSGWRGVALLDRLAAIMPVPTLIDTDVNCAALAEGREDGAAEGLERFCYITVGTGIGVGIVDRGAIRLGMAHAEAGHMRVGRAPGDTFDGICPLHSDCVEGLACGPAIAARWNMPAEALPANHTAWAHEAWYIAALCANLTYTLRPQRIVIGGGVLGHAALYNQVRRAFVDLTAGYALDRWSSNPATYLAAPAFVDPSPGLVGALMLAAEAAHAA